MPKGIQRKRVWVKTLSKDPGSQGERRARDGLRRVKEAMKRMRSMILKRCLSVAHTVAKTERGQDRHEYLSQPRSHKPP